MPSSSPAARTAARRPLSSVPKPSRSGPGRRNAQPRSRPRPSHRASSSTSSAPPTSVSCPRWRPGSLADAMSKSLASLGTGLKVDTSWTTWQTRMRRVVPSSPCRCVPPLSCGRSARRGRRQPTARLGRAQHQRVAAPAGPSSGLDGGLEDGVAAGGVVRPGDFGRSVRLDRQAVVALGALVVVPGDQHDDPAGR